MNGKPKHVSGYSSEETALVLSTVLTIFSKLGSLADDLVVVGGIAPRLLVDLRREAQGDDEAGHCGSSDLDLGLSLAILDMERYKEIAAGLRDLNFEPSINESGNPRLQKWREPDTGIEVDFLIPPTELTKPGGIQPLESDFGALSTRGLDLAFEDFEAVELSGTTLLGQSITRTVRVVGPGAFVVLKSFAFADRTEPKDAYDIDYVLAGWKDGLADIAARLITLRAVDRTTVDEALETLANDFQSLDHVGPRQRASFSVGNPDELAADAMGRVNDLLQLADDQKR